MLKGLDTAGVAGNGKVNWTATRAAGYRFAILRASVGLRADKVFPTYWPQLKAAGFVRGAYMFWRVADDPIEQVNVFDAAMKGALGAGDFVAFDLEFATDKKDPKKRSGRASWGFTAEEARARAEQSWGRLVDLDYEPIVYTSARIVDGPDLKGLPLVMADSPLWCVRRKKMVPKQWGGPNDWWISQDRLDINAAAVPGFAKGDLDLNSFNPLYKGMRGPRVKWLQQQLDVVPSGVFDKTTDEALRWFQENEGLSSDGIVGPVTFGELCSG